MGVFMVKPFFISAEVGCRVKYRTLQVKSLRKFTVSLYRRMHLIRIESEPSSSTISERSQTHRSSERLTVQTRVANLTDA